LITSKTILKAVVPNFLVEVRRVSHALSGVSAHPALDALQKGKRLALDRSRFSLFPSWLKSSLSFVIDIGANEGQWISSLMELLPISKIWIFEPNPDAMKTCQRKIGKPAGVTYFCLALGDADGQAELHVTASSDFASILPPNVEFLGKHYWPGAACVVSNKQVQIATLDSLVSESQSVDLLKVDVQGFERAVLSGAQRVLRRTKAVLIEANLQSHYLGDDTFPALWNQLADQGFSLWSFSSPYTNRDGKALWTDALFVKNDNV
jgi:FkbM family methyltransferase